ncbi:oxygenase MpaB family protein [Nonomuraea sp. B12E4]|uniref:oxygenase MpaB family protein n=1 Tax=Nonomuraea sp. B12E4 TaxID=3153564 RepID=UPI00325F27ED
MDVEPFGPGSMHWDTAGEYRNLLVAGSALVLQTMHPAVGAGAGECNHFVTVGTLPPAVRAKLGLRWTARDERRLRRLGHAVAMLTPRLPERLRFMPIAYDARKGARAAHTTSNGIPAPRSPLPR